MRKLWSAKLGEWLFGAGVATACLVPVAANSSVWGGIEYICDGSHMELCYDGQSHPCQTVSGDPTMFDACVIDTGNSGYHTAVTYQCPVGCSTAHGGPGTWHCSYADSCYY